MREVIKFLKIFTDLNVDEINKIKDEDINQLKIKLANEATSMLHGKDGALSAEKTAKKTFEENSLGEDLPSVDIQLNNENGIEFLEKNKNEIINKINENLTLVEKIKKFHLINENFSIENGLLTPTMKVKRKKVTEKYKNELEKLY